MKNQHIILYLLLFCSSINLTFATEALNTKSLDAKKVHKSYPWFKQSFLDLKEDISDAIESNKGLILYFYQDDCPYCKKLLNDNFSRSSLVTKLRNQYDFIAINMWGDSDVVDFDGSELTEKSLAVKLKVMFTPSLVFFNSSGEIEFRLNGYYSPEKFNYLLDYLNIKPKVTSFTQYYKNKVETLKKGHLADRTYIVKTKNYQKLANNPVNNPVNNPAKPIVLFFEEKNCTECNELHHIIESSPEIQNVLKRFTTSQVSIHSKNKIIDISGNETTPSHWSNELNIQHTPALVFYDKNIKTNKVEEVFRVDSYLKAFHLESVLLYIVGKHYHKFPEFQRYIHERVDILTEKGVNIELWK
jgi:thioredoxin-related protein